MQAATLAQVTMTQVVPLLLQQLLLPPEARLRGGHAVRQLLLHLLGQQPLALGPAVAAMPAGHPLA